MTIVESYKEQISKAFQFILFKKRNIEYLYEMLSASIHGTNFSLLPPLPPISNVKVEEIDEEHDKLSLCFDDITISGVITWKKTNDNGFIFMNYL